MSAPAAAEPAAGFFSVLSVPGSAALLEAQRALEARDGAKALAALEGYTGPATAWAELLRARAHGLLGKNPEALAALDRLPAPSLGCAAVGSDPAVLEPALLRADLLTPARPVEAARILAALPPSGSTLGRAAELARKADGDLADRLEARLLLEAPESLEARTAAAKLGAAGVAARLGTFGRRLDRVRALLDTHQNEAARDEAKALLTLLEPPPRKKGEKAEPVAFTPPAELDGAAVAAARCELLFILGKAQRKLRVYGEAVPALSRARVSCEGPNQEVGLKAALLEAQVRGIRGEVNGTRVVAEWLAKVHPQHSYVDDALFVWAEALEKKKQPDEAAKVYARIVEQHAAGDHAATAAWRLAFQAIRAGDAEGARGRLETILAGPAPRPEEHARARYWLAKLLPEKDEAAARRRYEELLEAPSFYAWLALDRLRRERPAWAEAMEKKLLSVRDAPAEAFTPAERIAQSPELARAKALLEAGAPAWAEAELARLGCGELSDAEALTLAHAFGAVGAHRRAQMLLRARPAMRRGPLSAEALEVWRATYSRPYLELVTKAAEAEKIEPLFLLALVREESTFEPRIVSWAGAVGLAQLMPGTAIGAYASVYGGKLNMERLTEPELNLRLGARVLREGLSGFDRLEPLALGAYNGGPGLVRRFLPAEAQPFDLWVETIGVKETRRYIKRVSETWGIYRLLYDRERPFITLPEAVASKAR